MCTCVLYIHVYTHIHLGNLHHVQTIQYTVCSMSVYISQCTQCRAHVVNFQWFHVQQFHNTSTRLHYMTQTMYNYCIEQSKILQVTVLPHSIVIHPKIQLTGRKLSLPLTDPAAPLPLPRSLPGSDILYMYSG